MQLNELSKAIDPENKAVYYKTSHGDLIFLRRDINNEETIIINKNNKFGKYIQQRKKIIGMLVTLIGVFYVCLFPIKIWNFVLILFGNKKSFYDLINLRQYWYISVSCRILFYLNSSVNPILYNWFSKRFRKNFRNFIYIPKFLFSNS